MPGAVRSAGNILDVFKARFYCVFGPHLPREVPGEGPDGHFLPKIKGVGLVPVWIQGVTIYMCMYIYMYMYVYV